MREFADGPHAVVRRVALALDGDHVIFNINDQLREERAEKVAAYPVVGSAVELGRVSEQPEVGHSLVGAVAEPLRSARELLGERLALHRRVLESGEDLRQRTGAARGELDQALLLRLELADLLLQLLLRLVLCGQQLDDRGADELTHVLDLVRVHPLGTDDSFQLGLDRLESNRRGAAEAPLFRCADEVLVGAAVAGVLAVKQSRSSAGVAALAAFEHALEVVRVDDVAVAGAIALVEHLLHLDEGLLGDDRLVAAAVELALVADDARVIRVTQDLGEAARADGLLRAARRSAGGQALLVQEVLELRDRVEAGGVLLERELDEVCAHGVDVDRVDEPPAEFLTHVEVAELGSSDGAALLDLVGHLDPHVLAVHTDLDFVHHVGDGLHGVGHVALSELLLCRDQAHALRQQLALRDRGVGEVSEDARAHVDDDEAHLGVVIEVAQELLELGALGDCLRGLPGLDELAHDGRLEFLHLARRLDALGCDAVAVLVDVGRGVELTRRRDAEVDDGLRNCGLHGRGRPGRDAGEEVLEAGGRGDAWRLQRRVGA